MYEYEIRNGMRSEDKILTRGTGIETAMYIKDEFGPHVIMSFFRKNVKRNRSKIIPK